MTSNTYLKDVLRRDRVEMMKTVDLEGRESLMNLCCYSRRRDSFEREGYRHRILERGRDFGKAEKATSHAQETQV